MDTKEESIILLNEIIKLVDLPEDTKQAMKTCTLLHYTDDVVLYKFWNKVKQEINKL